MVLTRGTVTDVYTDGYVEVAVWEDGKPGERREIAEVNYKKPRRNDVVDMEPAQPRETKYARLAYIGPVVFFLVGLLLGKQYEWGERLLLGAILFVITFVMAWLMNRPARLRRRLSWRVVRVIKKATLMSEF